MLLKALSSIALLSGSAGALLVGVHDEIFFDFDRLQAMMIAAGSDAPVKAYLLTLIGGVLGLILVMRNQPRLAVAAVAVFSIPFYLGICMLLTGPLLNSPSVLGTQAAITLCFVSTASVLMLFAVLLVNIGSGMKKLLPGVLMNLRR